MKKVELRMNEQNKYEIIKKLVETDENKKRAATKLGCTVRTINNLSLNTRNRKEEIHAWKPWKTARFCSSFRYKE